MRRWALFLLVLLFQGLSSCATLPPLPPETPSPSEVLDAVKAHRQSLQGLKGLAQIKVSSPGKSLSVQEALFVRRPASLRAETLSPMGIPQFYLATDGQDLSLFVPGENRYYQGRASAQFLSRLLPVALEPEEAVALLLGGPPPISIDQVFIRREEEERLWVLELASPSREVHQRLWVNPKTLQTLRAEYRRPGLNLSVTFLDFRPLQGGVLFPSRIQIFSAGSGDRVSLEYQEVEINPRWAETDFKLPVPKGADVVPLK